MDVKIGIKVEYSVTKAKRKILCILECALRSYQPAEARSSLWWRTVARRLQLYWVCRLDCVWYYFSENVAEYKLSVAYRYKVGAALIHHNTCVMEWLRWKSVPASGYLFCIYAILCVMLYFALYIDTDLYTIYIYRRLYSMGYIVEVEK